jgi:uncharacterized RDD family membrane protein YckC
MEERIKPATFGKRFLAYFIDSAIVIITGVILWTTVCSTTLADQMHGNDDWRSEMKVLDDSGIVNFTYNDDGSIKQGDSDFLNYYYASPCGGSLTVCKNSSGTETTDTQDKPGYTYYYSRVRHCYVDFLSSDSRIDDITNSDNTITKKADYYTPYYFNNTVMGLPSKESLASLDLTVEDNIDDANHYYKYQIVSGAVDFDAEPILTAEYETKINGSATPDAEACSNLKSKFITSTSSGLSSSFSGIYYDAYKVLSQQSYVQEKATLVSNVNWACMLVAFVPIQLIVFFLIPLCMPNGQTLGKLITRLAVVSKDGYKISWYSRIIRPLYMGVLGTLLVVIPNSLIGFFVFAGITLIDYVVMAVCKDGSSMSLHDKFSKTIVVDAKHSIWFASPEAEEDYLSQHPSTDLETGDSLLSPEEAARIERESSVLDLSTINRHKDEAHSMTSFDEFESTSYQTQEKKIAKEKAVALDSLASSIKDPNQGKKPKKNKVDAEVVIEKKPDESGFTDEEEDKK